MSFQLQLNLRVLHHIFFIVLLKETCAQLIAPSPTCPGQEAVFTCTADDAGGIGATVFIVNGDTAGRCLVRHDMVTPSVLTCGPGGAFIAANESVNGITYTSLLTVTAIEELNGTTVQCLSGAVVNSVSLHVIAPPQFPDAVSQDHSQDTVNRTTVINWQQATVDSPNMYVRYTVANDSLTLVDFDNATITATVVLPAFNTDYSFCVEAVNLCGVTSGTPRCATPPVRIEAKGPTISDIYSQLTCSVEPLAIRTLWTVDTSRNGNVFQPPVSSLTVMCNSVSKHLTTTATEFTFTDAGCISATAANITLNISNEVGSVVASTRFPSIYWTPMASGDTLQIKNGAVCIELNPECVESPLFQGFMAELKFTLDNDVIITVFGSLVTCDNGVRGFIFDLANLIQLKLETIPVTLTLVFNDTIIQTISSLNVRQEESDSAAALGAGIGGGVGGLVAVSALANLLLHAGLVLGWGYLCLLGWAGPCCSQVNRKQRMHGGLAFCVFLFYLTPVTTVLLTCYLCHLCCCKHSGDEKGAQLTAPSPTCPGQEAMFTCSADDGNGNSGTVFIVNGDAAGRCVVRHDMVTPSVLTCGPGGAFIAANESVNGITYDDTLTVTATEQLNGTTVQCLAGPVDSTMSLQVISLPSFPVSGNVTQDPDSSTASEMGGSTVISWSPASVDNYTLSRDGMTVTSTTDTTYTLTELEFNRTYSVSVEAVNVCNQPTGTPLSGTVIVRAAAPQPMIASLSLMCSAPEKALNTTITWMLDDNTVLMT